PAAMTTSRGSVALFAMGLALLGAPKVTAQADVIRGRVIAVGTEMPLENVAVTPTSLSGHVNRSARTDKDGRYTTTFPGGEGDYFVTFVAIGYAPRRFEVKRVADEDILIADARLSASSATLDTVVTLAARNRARPARRDTTPDVSGTERSVTTGLVPV